jgi:hypothetical protein
MGASSKGSASWRGHEAGTKCMGNLEMSMAQGKTEVKPP